MIDLSKPNGVYVLKLGNDENRFTPDWLNSINAALDDVVATPAPLVTIGDGKFYSNGLDLDWMMANPAQAAGYVADVQDLLARVLTLPVPTVAAVSGHAFGAGAMIAMAHDWRIMRADRGYLCFPEVDIRIPFTPGMAALVQAKLTPQGAVAAMTTGHRYPGPEALAAGLVDGVAAEAELLREAVARVEPLAGKDAGTLAAIKTTMFAGAVAALRSREPATSSQ
ncbi:MAG TPA: enoyl-CoA hydratase-related protein [Jatrophihabitantaceae bacterium]